MDKDRIEVWSYIEKETTQQLPHNFVTILRTSESSFSTKHSTFFVHAINDQVREGIMIYYVVIFTTHKIIDNINCQNWTNLAGENENFSTSKSYSGPGPNCAKLVS